MTKYDKANELLNKLDFEDGKYEITDALVDMYDWTKEQMINKVHDVVWKLLKGYHIEDCDGNIYNKPKFFEDLLKSMEEL